MGLKLAPMAPFDLVAVLPMLRQMAEDEARAYPTQTPEDIAGVQGWLLDQLCDPITRLPNPDFGAFVVRDGNKAKGVIWGLIERRAFMSPPRILCARIIYVMPSHRRRGIAARLLAALLAWGRERLGPDCIMEGTTLPGSEAYRLWLEAGWKPVYVRIAWIGEDGKSLAHAPLALRKPARDTPRMGGGAA